MPKSRRQTKKQQKVVGIVCSFEPRNNNQLCNCVAEKGPPHYRRNIDWPTPTCVVDSRTERCGSGDTGGCLIINSFPFSAKKFLAVLVILCY